MVQQIFAEADFAVVLSGGNDFANYYRLLLIIPLPAAFFFYVFRYKKKIVVEYWDWSHFKDRRLGNFVREFHCLKL